MSRWEYEWQRFFAWSGLLGVALCLVAWEIFWPQPPDFAMTGAQTAQFYADHRLGMLTGITVSSVAMPFLMAWSLQLGAILRRQEGGSGLVSIAATVGITAIPVLLSFDCAVWAVAAYRPATTNPDVTRAMSDLGWISSMLIWPPLAFGMILMGLIVLRTWRQPGALPRWLGWVSIIAGLAEPGQAPIIFAHAGAFAPNGPGSWYLAVFTWGPWIILSSIAQARVLARQRGSQALASGDSERVVASLSAPVTPHAGDDDPGLGSARLSR